MAITNYNPKDNLKNLQKAWRQDEYALKAIFGEDSFYQVLLKSWPEEKKEAYVNLINKKYGKEVISKYDLHIAEEKNSNSHIYIKEMVKDENGIKQFVASHFIIYTKTLRRNTLTNETIIDVQRSNIIKWQNSSFICFVWKYEKGNMRVLCKTKELISYLLTKGKSHTENNQSFIMCTLKEAILSHIVEAYWDTSVVDLETGSFDPFKYEVTIFHEGKPNKIVSKRNSSLFSKVDATSRMYEGKAHKNGTKLYFPDGIIKHYELQKDALKDICCWMAMNSLPYSNDEKTKMARNLKASVTRSVKKIEDFKNNKSDKKDSSFLKTGIYCFSGEISDEDIRAFIATKPKSNSSVAEAFEAHFSVLVNKSSYNNKSNKIYNNNIYYLKDTEVHSNDKHMNTIQEAEVCWS